MASAMGLAGCTGGPLPRDGAGRQMAQHVEVLPWQGRPTAQRFWLYLPRDYRTDGAPWPLVFFLHGSGQRGSDLAQVKVHGPPKLVEQGKAFPFILVSPQLDVGQRWDPHALQALARVLQGRLHVDADRISVTGLSLGGHGTWHWACAYPGQFAAIAPVCGFGVATQACTMRSVPVRAYHGDADSVVPLAAQQGMVDALRRCGGRAEFIVYPGVGHNAWDQAYADPALYAWLLAARRSASREGA